MRYKNNGGKELSNEFHVIDGFHGVEEEKAIPFSGHKDILIICTKKQHLVRLLNQWALKTGSATLLNPKNCAYDEVQKYFAIVVDSDIIDSLSIPEKICERMIPSDLDPELIVNILNGLKPRPATNYKSSTKHVV
jgi:hypothetical protein